MHPINDTTQVEETITILTVPPPYTYTTQPTLLNQYQAVQKKKQ
jgi:hypothetical protein